MMRSLASAFFIFAHFLFGTGQYGRQNGRLSVQKCEEYGWYDDDPIVFPEIVGGSRAKEYEFNHMAALGYGDKNERIWGCGGSLISEYFVLTAAHCLYPRVRGVPQDLQVVRLGTKNLQNPESTYRDYKIASRIPHPNYTFISKYNDIALVRLSPRVTFGPKIQPACLYITTDLTSPHLIASGWGATYYTGPESSYLLKVGLITYNYSYCGQVYRNQKRALPGGIDPLSMICAGGTAGQHNDTCHGDSGGPLQLFGGQYFIVGITSFSLRCSYELIPTIYTRVSDYIGWIEKLVWSDE